MGRMSLSIYMKGDYEEFHALKVVKNKPNQSQSPAFGRKSEIIWMEAKQQLPKHN